MDARSFILGQHARLHASDVSAEPGTLAERILGGLTDEQIQQAHMQRCEDVGETVERLAHEAGPHAQIAVLPQGPQTIPYVAR